LINNNRKRKKMMMNGSKLSQKRQIWTNRRKNSPFNRKKIKMVKMVKMVKMEMRMTKLQIAKVTMIIQNG